MFIKYIQFYIKPKYWTFFSQSLYWTVITLFGSKSGSVTSTSVLRLSLVRSTRSL